MLETFPNLGSYGDLATPITTLHEVQTDVLTNNNSLNIMLSELYNTYVNMLDHRGGKFNLSEEDFIAYCTTLIYHRCVYTNSHSREYSRYRFLVHPHILGTIIACIGVCYNTDINLAIRPSIPEYKPLNEDEMMKIDLTLKSLGATFNLSFGKELVRDKKGDFKVMSFSLIKDEIRGRDNSAHPTQALIALLAGVNLAESILAPRVTYITKDNVNLLSRAAASMNFGGAS